jgi:hypothetical protein
MVKPIKQHKGIDRNMVRNSAPERSENSGGSIEPGNTPGLRYITV